MRLYCATFALRSFNVDHYRSLTMAILKADKVTITGGCLCEAVRYNIEFPAGSLWPPQVRHSVDCDMHVIALVDVDIDILRCTYLSFMCNFSHTRFTSFLQFRPMAAFDVSIVPYLPMHPMQEAHRVSDTALNHHQALATPLGKPFKRHHGRRTLQGIRIIQRRLPRLLLLMRNGIHLALRGDR